MKEQTVGIAKRIAWCQKFMGNYDGKVRLERFNNGEMCDEWNTPFFWENFYIRYNPKNGRLLDWFDVCILDENFKNRLEFHRARYELKEFKENNPNYTEEELQAFIYKKGMELLPEYKDYIL